MWTGNSWSLDMIIVYSGTGKGKSCACVGQAIRASGAGLKVAFGQFLKRSDVAGEQKILARLPNIDFCSSGLGFVRENADLEAHRAKAQALIAWAASREVDMLVLDEALNALAYGVIDREDLRPWLKAGGNRHFHFVLSGRKLPGWLAEIADTITELEEIKHQHRQGVQALPGVEF